MEPHDVTTADTLAFLEAVLPRDAGRVLEVGCGSGRVAAALAATGRDVLAIDRSSHAVAEARSRGVPARRIDWFDLDESGFEAIVFTRSLHHIHPLEDAVALIAPRLAPGAVVVLEEFAREEVDPMTLGWFGGLAKLLVDTGEVRPQRGSLLKPFLRAPAMRQAWLDFHDHDPPLHTITRIDEVLRRHLRVQQAYEAPYLYRYLCSCVSDDADGAAVVARVMETERELITSGIICGVGRRFVATAGNGQPA